MYNLAKEQFIYSGKNHGNLNYFSKQIELKHCR